MITAVVGAGGKTSITLKLAEELSHILTGRVFVTTTTHMMRESGYGFMLPDEICGIEEQLEWIEGLPWNEQPFLLIGGNAHKDDMPDKLCSLPDKLRISVEERCEASVIEADGARKMPFKIPGINEPVIPPETNLVLVVMGLGALDKKLRDCAFRSDELAEYLMTDEDHILNEYDCAQVLTGAFKDRIRKQSPAADIVYVINQADNEALTARACKIADLMFSEKVLITSFR